MKKGVNKHRLPHTHTHTRARPYPPPSGDAHKFKVSALIAGGTMVLHQSRFPLHSRDYWVIVNNIQRHLGVETGRSGQWSAAAWQSLRANLAKPKRRGQAPPQLALPAPLQPAPQLALPPPSQQASAEAAAEADSSSNRSSGDSSTEDNGANKEKQAESPADDTGEKNEEPAEAPADALQLQRDFEAEARMCRRAEAHADALSNRLYDLEEENRTLKRKLAELTTN